MEVKFVLKHLTGHGGRSSNAKRDSFRMASDQPEVIVELQQGAAMSEGWIQLVVLTFRRWVRVCRVFPSFWNPQHVEDDWLASRVPRPLLDL